MAEKKKKSNPVVNYFKDVKGEMKKVSWPTFKQIKNNTIIVIVSVVIIGLFIALLDFGFGKGFDYLINRESAKTEQSAGSAAGSDKIDINNAVVDGEPVEVAPDAADNAQDNTQADTDDAQAGDKDGE